MNRNPALRSEALAGARTDSVDVLRRDSDFFARAFATLRAD
jgi:hypothetical protein